MNRNCGACGLPEESCTCRPIEPQLAARSLDSDSAIYSLLQHQTELLTQLSQQTSYFLAALSMFSQKLDRIIAASSSDSQPAPAAAPLRIDDSITVQDLMKALCGGNQRFDFQLVMKSQLPTPAFKDRAFAVTVAIEMSTAGVCADPPPHTLEAKLFLFTCENPPKLLRTTTLGEKIIKGDTEVQNEGCEFVFRKVVIKEVTSHFPNGCFFLVVAVVNRPDVKPIIVEKFVVKARKILGDGEIKKRVKLDDTSVS